MSLHERSRRALTRRRRIGIICHCRGGQTWLRLRAIRRSHFTWSETMTELNDRAYYAGRVEKAAKLAATATDPEIAAIHRRMADSYLELIELTPEGRRTLQLVED